MRKYVLRDGVISSSAMFFQVLGEDEDVIDVYTYNAAADEILENIIHHSLELGRWPGC
jgi:hypothetical protein